MQSYQRSRLSRKMEKQNKKQVTLMLLGIILVLFLFFKFGISALSAVSDFFISLNEKKDNQTNSKSSVENFVQPPFLDAIPVATTSSSLFVSGTTVDKDGLVEVFLNDSKEAEIEIKDGKFIDKVDGLKEGDNIVKARTKIKDDKMSNFTRDYLVTYTKKGPELDVTFPTEGSTFTKSNQINVTGKTNSSNSVTVNGFIAIVDENGNFSYYLKLNDGDNTITVVAQNPAGVTTKKEIKVKYSP